MSNFNQNEQSQNLFHTTEIRLLFWVSPKWQLGAMHLGEKLQQDR